MLCSVIRPMFCVDPYPALLWWAHHAEQVAAAFLVGWFLAGFYLRVRWVRRSGVSS